MPTTVTFLFGPGDSVKRRGSNTVFRVQTRAVTSDGAPGYYLEGQTSLYPEQQLTRVVGDPLTITWKYQAGQYVFLANYTQKYRIDHRKAGVANQPIYHLAGAGWYREGVLKPLTW